MPIIRKIIPLGNSEVVSIPRSWLRFYEKQTGQEINEVTVEVNRKLIIEPYVTVKEGGHPAKSDTSPLPQVADKCMHLLIQGGGFDEEGE